MTPEKQKKLVVASTVGAVLLLLILLMVMIYQLVAIKVENNRKKELDAAIAEYKQLKEVNEDTIEVRSSYQWIVRRARQLGYRFVGDELLDD